MACIAKRSMVTSILRGLPPKCFHCYRIPVTRTSRLAMHAPVRVSRSCFAWVGRRSLAAGASATAAADDWETDAESFLMAIFRFRSYSGY